MSCKKGLTEDFISKFLETCDESDFEEVECNEVEDDLEEEEHIDTDEQADSEAEYHAIKSSGESSSKIIQFTSKVLRGKNRHVWSTEKPKTSARQAAINIVHKLQGPTRKSKGITDPLACFELFLTDEIVNEVVKWTNVEIEMAQSNYGVLSATQSKVEKDEIKAFIGLLILTAALKDNHLNAKELFDASFSGNRYVSTMSKARFYFLTQCLRFDDKSERLKNISNDKFTPIRKVWDIFIDNCRTNYEPGLYVTIDEQLLAFRGRSSFRMYIPNKPAKYGLKIVMLCDAGTKYMVDAMPYLGKNTNTGGLPLGEYFVKELTRTIHGSNRNVTMDNWFTSVPLAKSLLCLPYKLTILGTLRSNKKEIPMEMLICKDRQVGTYMFCFDNELTLLSYKPKPNKMVYMLSSSGEEGTVNSETNKPHMIEYYNQSKGAVDTFDQMCSIMSCSQKTSRWPMCIFYGLLNMASINSYVIYCHNSHKDGKKPLNRKDYMKELHTKLVLPWLKKRMEVPTLRATTRNNIENLTSESGVAAEINLTERGANKKRKICGFCPYQKHRMTKSTCAKCGKSVCGEHKIEVCNNCS